MAVILSQLYASLITNECVKSEMGILRHDISIGLLLDELLEFCRDYSDQYSSSSNNKNDNDNDNDNKKLYAVYSLALSTCLRLLECEYGKVSEYEFQSFLHQLILQPASCRSYDAS